LLDSGAEAVTRAKSYGITDGADARAGVSCDAHAPGLIFVDYSPRLIDSPAAGEIGRRPPRFVSRVAVIRDAADWMTTPPNGFDHFQYYTNARRNRRAPGQPGHSARRRLRAYCAGRAHGCGVRSGAGLGPGTRSPRRPSPGGSCRESRHTSVRSVAHQVAH